MHVSAFLYYVIAFFGNRFKGMGALKRGKDVKGIGKVGLTAPPQTPYLNLRGLLLRGGEGGKWEGKGKE